MNDAGAKETTVCANVGVASIRKCVACIIAGCTVHEANGVTFNAKCQMFIENGRAFGASFHSNRKEKTFFFCLVNECFYWLFSVSSNFCRNAFKLSSPTW